MLNNEELFLPWDKDNEQAQAAGGENGLKF